MNRSQLFPQIPLKQVEMPLHRRLRIYSVDPSLAQRVDSLGVAISTVVLPWEPLQPGPIGEYLEVIDVDPIIQGFYIPVDLDHPYTLVQDGFEPTLSDPRFHQQMVFAVAMATITSFEAAWGRQVQWAPRHVDPQNPNSESYLPRLRLYPHGMRAENAFYDPATGSIIFGYFRARDSSSNAIMPRSLVFTCLSADVIAHEMTHAILDGIHPRFIEDSNLDVLAFHESFADLVALLQHFGDAELLADQIARGRGNLDTENLLAKLASEFGLGTSGYGALRDAIGQYDEAHEWRRKRPDPQAYASSTEAHARGAILVSAVFDAYLTMYKVRTRDLIRIATSGTGVLPSGDIHPDLVRRLASEAVKAAQHLMTMLVRAIDYCPPFDITFGEYLRAVITADVDAIGAGEDRYGYRLALAVAFSSWGIYPEGVSSMDPEELRWRGLEGLIPMGSPALDRVLVRHIRDRVMDLRNALARFSDRGELVRAVQTCSVSNQIEHALVACALPYSSTEEIELRRSEDLWGSLPAANQSVLVDRLTNMSDRELEFAILKWFRRVIHNDVARAIEDPEIQANTQIVSNTLGITPGRTFEVHAARICRRASLSRLSETDYMVFIELTQHAYLNQRTLVEASLNTPTDEQFLFRGGCTLAINVNTAEVKYAIRKRFESEERRLKQRDYLAKRGGLAAVYFDQSRSPFALIHSGVER